MIRFEEAQAIFRLLRTNATANEYRQRAWKAYHSNKVSHGVLMDALRELDVRENELVLN
jgi:hypothetical protein